MRLAARENWSAEVLEDFFKPTLELQRTSPNIILFDHIKRAMVEIPYPMSRELRVKPGGLKKYFGLRRLAAECWCGLLLAAVTDLSNDEHREEFPHCLVEIQNTVYASYISCKFCGLFSD
ncbi:hypothetical protein M422DRAFT_271043 [Sphaerobolus stellatus SS14]|uniref:Uncharacterized protein n=1 Tax=Sphaerobolus stellatus (strain SS14) TaxID=990650 RepID=A0A0C9U156_SPHS4|nr:hypothetical protein M422DRAFT_271043 [Sphaerobolus stellatus SS14]